MHILITSIQGPAGQALLAQFAEARHSHHRVVGVDVDPVDHPVLHAAEQVPPASDPTRIDRLVEIVRRHDIDVVIPTVEEELSHVARATEECRFYPARVVISEAENVDLACDKYQTMLRLEQAWVPIPRFTCPSHHQGPSSVVEAVGEHAIIKPRTGGGSLGVRELHPALLREAEWLDIEEDSLIQEFAAGQEFASMVYLPPGDAPPTVVVVEATCGPDDKASDAHRLPGDICPEVRRIALAAARTLGLRGPVDVDLRCLADGRPVVLEVNARFGADTAHAPEILDALLQDLTADLVPGLSADWDCR